MWISHISMSLLGKPASFFHFLTVSIHYFNLVVIGLRNWFRYYFIMSEAGKWLANQFCGWLTMGAVLMYLSLLRNSGGVQKRFLQTGYLWIHFLWLDS